MDPELVKQQEEETALALLDVQRAKTHALRVAVRRIRDEVVYSEPRDHDEVVGRIYEIANEILKDTQ